jgi:uncharacterized coiled-coil protein SlyX
MPDTELTRVYNELHSVNDRLREVESRLFGLEKQTATQLWVTEKMSAMDRSLTAMQSSIEGSAKKLESLFTMHDQMLRDRAEQEKALNSEKIDALKKNTLTTLIKEKWTPILAFIIALSAVFGLMSGWITYQVSNRTRQEYETVIKQNRERIEQLEKEAER